MLKRYKGNDGEPPFSSQLTDITKVNFHLLFLERNAMASSLWQGNVLFEV